MKILDILDKYSAYTLYLYYKTPMRKGIYIPKDHHYNANNKRKKGKKKGRNK